MKKTYVTNTSYEGYELPELEVTGKKRSKSPFSVSVNPPSLQKLMAPKSLDEYMENYFRSKLNIYRMPSILDMIGGMPKYAMGTEGGIDIKPLVNFGVGMVPVVGSIYDTYQAFKNPSLANIGAAAAGWGLDAMMLLGPAGFAARQAIKAAVKAKRFSDAGKSLYRINKTTNVAKRETAKAIDTALTKNRKMDAGLLLAQEAYNKYAE